MCGNCYGCFIAGQLIRYSEPVNFHRLLGAGVAAGIAATLCTSIAQAQPVEGGSSNIDSHFTVLEPYATGPAAPMLFGDYAFAGVADILSKIGAPGLFPKATVPPAEAAPAQFRELRHIKDNVWELHAYSPSMDRVIVNDIILPPGGLENTAPRPTFYLLGGAGGGADQLWWDGGGASEFFKDKQINVVTPRGAFGSMMADWNEPHDTHGNYKWSTYLTKELPQLIDAQFHGTGRDAIAGVSNSGGPSLEMSTYDPRFVVAGSYSGCPSSTGVVGQAFAWVSVAWFGADPSHMWGPPWDPTWARHSPVLNLDSFRDKKLFVMASRGVPADFDIDIEDSPLQALGVNEQLDHWCTSYFVKQAQKKGLDVKFYDLPEGRHTWALFRRELIMSWETIGPALGVE